MNIFAIFVAAWQEGYLAIAPELYFRQGDPNEYHDIPTLFKELVSKVPDAQVLAISTTSPAGRRATAAMPIVC
jgi:dienelactone hydrolase